MAVLNGVDERTRLLSSTPSFRREIEEEEEAINGILKVEWEGPYDPKNPKNWRPVRKWTCCMLVSLYSLIAPTASSMVVPAMPTLSRDLGITSATMTQLTLSVFVLGWGIGPVFMGPLSEMFGRAPVLHLGQLGFLIVNALCGVTTGPNTFFFFRLCSGILGSGPMSLGAGVLSDLWVSDERGMSLAIYTVMPLLGPTAGPVLGGIIVQYRSWREIFFICSLFTGACLTLGLIILPETFPPILLHRKRVALLKTGAFQDSKLLHSSRREKFHKLITVELPRPFILLGTQPIVQTLALYMGLLFGLNHLTISTFHALWRDIYHESDLIGSLNYISISLGFLFGCQVAGPMNDKIYGYLKKRNNNTDLPEYRIWLMIPASLLVPIGLLWYGWSAAYKLHWLMPNIGILIYSFGLIIGYQCIQAYALDCYPVYAASAMGALTVLRAFAGFSLPLVAPAMYRVFGYGWSSTVLAGIALVVGGGAPWLLSVKGPMLRAKSPYAAGDVKLVL